MEYKELNKQFWGQHLWARGYFVASSGNVTDAIIKAYIQNQDLQEKNTPDNFDIGWKWREEDNLMGQTLGCFSSTSNLPALAGRGLDFILCGSFYTKHLYLLIMYNFLCIFEKGIVTINFDYIRHSIKHNMVLDYLVYVFLNTTTPFSPTSLCSVKFWPQQSYDELDQ